MIGNRSRTGNRELLLCRESLIEQPKFPQQKRRRHFQNIRGLILIIFATIVGVDCGLGYTNACTCDRNIICCHDVRIDCDITLGHNLPAHLRFDVAIKQGDS